MKIYDCIGAIYAGQISFNTYKTKQKDKIYICRIENKESLDCYISDDKKEVKPNGPKKTKENVSK